MKRLAILGSAIALMLVSFVRTLPEAMNQAVLHEQVLRGTAEAPLRYRLLATWLAEGAARLLPLPYDAAVIVANYYVLGGTALALYVVGVYVLLKRLYSADKALIAGVFVCLSMNVIHIYPSLQAYTWIEAAVFVWSLVWLLSIYRSHS